ncbi:MAG: transcription antitermination factor NusB [Thermomicrobiales bacterium]
MVDDDKDQQSGPKRRDETSGPSDAAARRHLGRMLALQVLYEVDLTNHDPDDAIARAMLEHEPVPDGVERHVRALVTGALEHQDELDPVLAAAAPARSLSEQAAIERNVLRLASYELLHEPEVPPKVVINEAVELAKRFGGEHSGRFINGVLRTVADQHPRSGWNKEETAERSSS